MHSPQITPKVELLLRQLQPHNQGVLLGRPTAPHRPSYVGGARSNRGSRALSDTVDHLALPYDPPNGEWPYIVPWGVIYPGQDHTSNNATIEVIDARIAFLPLHSEAWDIIDFDFLDVEETIGYRELPYVCENVQPVVEARKNVPIYKTNPIHFWRNGRIQMTVKPKELRGVYIGFKVRTVLIDENGVDDRPLSDLYMNAAFDFYPDELTQITSDLPMGSSSRFTKVWAGEQIIQACTIEPTGQIWRDSSYKGSVLLPLKDFLLTDHEILLDW